MFLKSFGCASFLTIFSIGALASLCGQEANDATADMSPAARLKRMQGTWEVTAIYEPSSGDDSRFPDEIVFAKRGAKVTVTGNAFHCEKRTVATIANDLSLPAQQAEKGFNTFDLAMLTLPSGRGILCSYFVSPKKPDAIELAYTHKTFCHRGSGHILVLRRIAK